jgi:heme-degrading monooxygenase HmoA
MYGTVARMCIKPGAEDQLRQLSREDAQRIEGFVFEHVYRMDVNPEEIMLVVAFESKEAYRANAESPEQHERYQRYRELLTADPEWHDGEIIFSFPE